MAFRSVARRTQAILFAAAMAMTMSFAFAQSTPTKPTRVRGVLVAVSPDAVIVKRDGSDTVTVELKPEATVSSVLEIKLQDIKAGSFVGSTAVPDADGHLMAKEVHVFPESARGSGEGHYEWDLGPTSSMTNANVDLIVEGTTGRDLKLSYKGGTKTITVPVGTPVVTGASATRADLIVGKRVFLAASRDDAGHLVTSRIVVEKNGLAPPF